MDSKILIGIIAVTIFGTLGVQGTMVQAGVLPIETIQVEGPFEVASLGSSATSSATCPISHPFLIGGSYLMSDTGDAEYLIIPNFDTNTNTFEVTGESGTTSSITVRAFALCANFNFPMQMGMVGGELLDINTVSLLIASIGVNPIITGLVGITIAGVVGQAVWFVHRRRKK